MRKRFEEELSKLAFGDLDAEEARRLEMQTLSDPEASETFQAYRRMKEELRSLAADVPADQLSKERLREAILSRGMKEQLPRTAKPTWIWMPAMAAVLAFGFMFVKGQLPFGDSPRTVVVDKSTPEAGITLPKLDSTPLISRNPVASHNRKPSLVVENEPITVASNIVDRSSRYDRSNDGFSGRNRGSEEMIPPGAAALDLMSQPTEGQEHSKTVSFDSEKKELSKPEFGSFAPAPMAGTDASKPTIVLIQSETDADTGTLKAREVSSTANVVIGG